MSSTPTVLLVDDDAEFLDLASQLFDRAGVSSLTATSAQEGLSLLEARTVDCAVSDSLVLPDGEPLVSALRRVAPDVPIVLFTGQPWEAVADDALAADVSEYVQKGHPHAVTSLVDRVRHFARVDDVAPLERVAGPGVAAMPLDEAVSSQSVSLGSAEFGPAWAIIEEFDFDGPDEIDAVIIGALADYADVDVDAVAPLYETIDADALSAVLCPRLNGEPRKDVQVRFPFAGFELAVTGTGLVAVRSVSPADSA